LIDLHTHSTASDGTLEPAALINEAVRRGVTVLALTDHDTLSGLSEAYDESKGHDLKFIPGIELSADYYPGTMHMLGYYVDPSDAVLGEKLTWLRDGRNRRNSVILEKLTKAGCPMDMADLDKYALGESVGRPHIARAMVEKGYLKTEEEAFNRFLAKGAAAYANKERTTPAQAIELILGAGGLPVLAHPQTLDLDSRELLALVEDLAKSGLVGIETYYYSHSEEETVLYKYIAKDLGLIVTGGTDYHGPGFKGIDLGRGLGGMKVPEEVVEGLENALCARR